MASSNRASRTSPERERGVHRAPSLALGASWGRIRRTMGDVPMLRLWLMVCVCLGLLAIGPAPVVASAEPPHKEGDAAKEGAKEAGKDTSHKTDDKSAGHPAPHAEGPPDIFKWSIDLTIWTMVVFLLLLVILWRF